MKYFIFFCLIVYSTGALSQNQMVNSIDSIGLKQGTWIEFKVYPTKSITYTSQDGYCKECYPEYYDSLVVYHILYKQIGTYLNGLKHGQWNEYDQNDLIRSSVQYKNGVINGEFKLFHSNGNLKGAGCINNKARTMLKAYDPKGNLIGERMVSSNEILRMLYLK